MAEHVAVFEIDRGQGRGTQAAPQLQGAVSFTNVSVAGTGISGELPQPIIPFSAYYPTSPATPGAGSLATGFRGVVTDSGGVLRGGSSDAITPNWHTAEDATGISPNLELPIHRAIPSPTAPGLGRNAPGLVLQWDGDAQDYFEGTSVDPPPGIVSVSGTYTYAYGVRNPYQGLTHYCEFEDDPPDTADDGTAVVTQLAQSLAYPSTPYVIGPNSVGQVQAEACNFAAVGPNCAVYIDASDFGGNGPDIIPAAVTGNLASIYRYHPSVFIRNTSHVRSTARRYRDGQALTAQQLGTPIRIDILGENPPRSSTWLLVFDGVPQVVTFLHPLGSLYKRPRDIWNQLLVPMILGPQSVSQAPILETPFVLGILNTGGPAILQLSMATLEYARYLGPTGTPTPQTGSTPA